MIKFPVLLLLKPLTDVLFLHPLPCTNTFPSFDLSEVDITYSLDHQSKLPPSCEEIAMWSQAVSGAHYSEDDQDHWLMPQEQLPVSNTGVVPQFEQGQFMGPSMNTAPYPDQMPFSRAAPSTYDSSFAFDQSSSQQHVPGFFYIVPNQAQQRHHGVSGTPTLTENSSPTVDGASLCTVEPYTGAPPFHLPDSAVQQMGPSWYAWPSTEQNAISGQELYERGQQPVASLLALQSAHQAPPTMSKQQLEPVPPPVQQQEINSNVDQNIALIPATAPRRPAERYVSTILLQNIIT